VRLPLAVETVSRKGEMHWLDRRIIPRLSALVLHAEPLGVLQDRVGWSFGSECWSPKRRAGASLRSSRRKGNAMDILFGKCASLKRVAGAIHGLRHPEQILLDSRELKQLPVIVKGDSSLQEFRGVWLAFWLHEDRRAEGRGTSLRGWEVRIARARSQGSQWTFPKLGSYRERLMDITHPL